MDIGLHTGVLSDVNNSWRVYHVARKLTRGAVSAKIRLDTKSLSGRPIEFVGAGRFFVGIHHSCRS